MISLANRLSGVASSRVSIFRKSVLFVAWLMLVGFMVQGHVFWRDEVRALSFALQGDSVSQMVNLLHGEGHPALWYLSLRGLHAIWDTPAVLPIFALVIAIAAAALLIFCSGIAWPFLPLVMFSCFFSYEYSVMARNYGISMLLLFATVYLYQRTRPGFAQALGTGILLMLLANTNVHSVVLVAGVLVFSLVEVVRTRGFRFSASLGWWCMSAAFAATGVIACVLTVYPPFNDAATLSSQGGVLMNALLAIILPGLHFSSVFPVLNMLPLPIWSVLASLLLFGSTLAVIRSLSAWIATLLTLCGLSLIFAVVYPGRYRHEALWLVFLVSMVWIEGLRRSDWPYAGRFAIFAKRARPVGLGCLLILFLFQLPVSAYHLVSMIRHVPESRSADLGALVKSHPEFRDAWIVADPDYLVEPLAYYLPNPTYLLREHRPGQIVVFSKKAEVNLQLDQILLQAQTLHQETRRPVLILLSQRITPDTETDTDEGYNWKLIIGPGQARRFLDATKLVTSYAPVTNEGESYDVYAIE